MPEKGVDFIAAGHLCLDMFPRLISTPDRKGTGVFQPGSLIQTGEMTISTGGTVSNTGMALKRFGCRVAFMARVGDDSIGEIILAILRKEGCGEGITLARGEASSYTVVLAPQGIDRIFLHCPGANDTFSLKDIDFSAVEKGRLFHLGYPTLMKSLFAYDGRELAKIFEEVKKRGLTTSLDISLPDPDSPAGRANWRRIYERTLPHVDLFLPSIEEAFFTLNPGEYLARKRVHGGAELIDHLAPQEFGGIADTFMGMGCAMVSLKAGHLGWYFRTGSPARLKALGRLKPQPIRAWADREVWSPAFQVESIVSATGAGDASIAAFLAALLKGYSLEGCLALANCAGSMNLRGMDALKGLASWDEMIDAIPDLSRRDVPLLHNTEWQWDAGEKVWQRMPAARKRRVGE